MRFAIVGPLTAVVAFVLGCGDGGDAATAEGPAEPISYKVFVGYPAVARTIEIDEDGSATTTVQYPDEKQPQRSEFDVPEEQLDAIRAHLAASDLSELPDEQVTDLVYATITYGDEEGSGGTAEAPEQNEDTPEDLRIAIEMLTDLMPPLKEPESGDEGQP